MDAADRVSAGSIVGPRMRQGQRELEVAALERDPLLGGFTPRVGRTQVAPSTRAPSSGSATDPSAGSRGRRGDDPSVALNALAQELGITPAALEAAIQKTRQAQADDASGADQPSGFDPLARLQQRAVRTARAAQNLGVEPRRLHRAIQSAADLPRGANPLQHAAQQLNADPNALMVAMQQNGLAFVDQYA